MKYFFSLVFLLLFISSRLFSQDDLGGKLSKVGSVYAVNYLTPLNDALGANLHSGFFHNANVPFDKKKPLAPHFYFGLKMFATFLSSSDKQFNLSYQDEILVNGVPTTANYTVYGAPTVIGNTSAAVATGTYDSAGVLLPAPDQTLIGGIANIKVIPLAIPQIGFGTVYGTDAAIRFFPRISIGDFGSFGYIGFAVRHNVSRYFKKIPVDIAVQVGYQGFSLRNSNDENLFSSRAYFGNVEISKSIKFLTVYGGFQYEYFKTDVAYTHTDGTNTSYPVNFTLTGNNSYRGILGFTLGTGLFQFNTDISIGKYFMLSTGLGVGM